ncbi:MAG: ABC transporter ATP-binding protein [Roseiflexaceae bacterium]|nr:ABC transporter ATP-binding protein [Roseiflexaceae bacterium]
MTLQLDRLTKTYRDGTQALRGISLLIQPGEIIVLLGPSGCGKSTLLRLIAGLDVPTSGQVYLGTRDITYTPAERRDMGMVFQNYALFPHMSVAENIGFGLRVRGITRAERQQRVEAMLEKLQLIPLADRRPDQLSGGQQQRVALGRALAINPSVLLLDEPLTALDAQLRESLRSELRRTLEQFRTTSIYVTHDQTEAMSLGDRVVVLRNGLIEQVGTPRALYQRPASAFVARFIGSANRIGGVLRLTATGPSAETALGPVTLAAAPAGAADGALIDVFVRPEDVTVVPAAGAALLAAIVQVEFLGDRLRLQVRTTTGATITASVAAHTMISTNLVGLCIRQAIALPTAGE